MATPPQNDMLCGDDLSSCSQQAFGGNDDDQSLNSVRMGELFAPVADGDRHPPNNVPAGVAASAQAAEEPESEGVMAETQDFLTAEFNRLSYQEQKKAQDDVHCVGEELQATDEVNARLLVQFDQGVQAAMPNPIYETAVNQNRSYVEDKSFRLKFLKANSHNVSKSVHQMMDFLDIKATCFGIDKVTQDITIDDLTASEKGLMMSNIIHIQDETDQSGRAILHFFNLVRCELLSLIRVQYYILFNILSPRADVQTKGCVLIFYDDVGDKDIFMPDLNFRARAFHSISCLPVRFCAVHLCVRPRGLDLALANFLLGLVKTGLPEHSRSRVRILYESPTEIKNNLQRYGIPSKSFPMDLDGNFRQDVINEWLYNHLPELQEQLRAIRLQAIREREVQVNPDLVLLGITQNDVLLGRGRGVQNHPGNLRFREFLEGHAAEYENAPTRNKSEVSAVWARELLERGFRFLKKEDDDRWIECSLVEVVDKVSQFFRTLRRKATNEGNNNV